MTTDHRLRQEFLQDFNFSDLFIEGLFWDNPTGAPVPVVVDDFTYTLTPVSQKAGFVIFECGPDSGGNIPDTPTRRKIDTQVAKIAYEHLIIFVDMDRTAQTWQWVKREDGKEALRQISYYKGQSGAALLQRVAGIESALDSDEELGQVASKVKKALDVERVTKRFYERFRRELTRFQGFVEGIAEQGDRDWYASLMLNRMMFVYFIQKRGFLDGDRDYLRNRLRMVQAQSGGGRFQQFYRLFLLRLFNEGLGQPESERSPELAMLLGKVPYLNGGLFDVHELESDPDTISIPDEAFERVFAFFDAYQWTLDDRPHMDDNEINPDVLGYIFEKYINQKQMGAYYTKEDITGYITRNAVIPYLFDSAKKECPVAFRPDGGVWRLLQDDPDRYIYPAVGHGVAWEYSAESEPVRLNAALDLPALIAAGVDDVSERGGWNESAPEKYALPTETWREVVARRSRYAEVRAKLASGGVQEINDLITLNLDIERFALDAIVQSEGPELLRAFWKAISRVSALDPTCGSGAFLFAALNVLEPLYAACIEGMRGFVEDIRHSQIRRRPEYLSDFKAVLEHDARHPSSRYYVLKSIVLNNLYGVDIMEEAVEICKLRLFLKLVAQLESYDQIEPLPDIDFNIRAGNTLVGFTSLDAVRQAMTVTPGGQTRMLSDEDRATLARIEEDAEIAARAFDRFREQQTALCGAVTPADKAELRECLDALRDQLDRHLAAEYGIDAVDSEAYDAWRVSHQPFHWFVEFYGIMAGEGFDVMIGNPPYVEYRKVKGDYTVKGYATEKCGNIYALCSERASYLTKKTGRFCFIVPLSIQTTKRMSPLQEFLLGTNRDIWLSSFDVYPCKLFEGAKQRLTILLTSRTKHHTDIVWTTRYLRWRPAERPALFEQLEYAQSQRYTGLSVFPKSGGYVAASILEKIKAFHPEEFIRPQSEQIYVHRIPYNYVKAVNFVPYFNNELRGKKKSDDYKPYCLATPSMNLTALAIINSNLFFFRWHVLFEGYHCGKHEITSFPFGLSRMGDDMKIRLAELAERLMADMEHHSTHKSALYKTTGRTTYQEFYPSLSKPIIDEIDYVLSDHYGFNEEELDFIVNYDIKYRVGRRPLKNKQ